MKNSLRITSGEYRGRGILTPGGATHPMGERERLALFNMIASEIPGALVLDAFAGSGALGVEMLSRGACVAVFVEKNPTAVKVIRQNLKQLGIPETTMGRAESGDAAKSAAIVDSTAPTGVVVQSTVRDFTTQLRFDIIVADPPYDDFRANEVAGLVKFLKYDGVLVLSHPDEAPDFESLEPIKTRSYAGANLTIYKYGIASD